MQAKKAKVEAIYQLSFLQQALLFHSLQKEDFDQGFLHIQCELKGKIDLDVFQQSWKQTIQRHESLRTSIHWENLEKPVQVVHKEVLLPFTFYDWSAFTESEQKAKFEELKHTDLEETLDLTKAPVLRLFLIKLSEDRHFLLWSCHHILADGWSASIILKDLLAFYDANYKGANETQLPAIPSYKSYLNWIKSQDKTKAQTFWKEMLQGFETPTLVGKSKYTKSVLENRFQSVSLRLSEEESQKLRDFSQKNQITLNTLIQGIWAILLSLYVEKDDVTFGTIVSGRSIDLPNAELMAGMYMNVLPLRINLDSNEGVSDWLKTLQLQQSKIRNFEYINLDEILNSNSFSKGKLMFDSLVVFENMPLENIKGGDISIESFESGLTSNYALTLAVSPLKVIEFHLKNDSSLVSENQISWFSRNLYNIIQTIIQSKTNTLTELTNCITPIDLENTQDQILDRDEIILNEFIVPRNEVELKLINIWETLLNRQPISVTEDFFDVGGTSIIAIRLFTEIEKQFNKKLQPISLLKHRNVGSLSKLVADENSEEKFSSLVPLRASGSKPPIFCLHAGGGHVFFYKDLAKHLGDDQPVYALQRLGLDDITQASQTIETMAAYYLEEISKIQPVGPYSLLGFCFSISIAWEMAKQLSEKGEKVSVLAMIDSPPFYRDKRTKEEKVNGIIAKLKKFDFSFLKTIWQGRIKHPIKQKWEYFKSEQNVKDQQRLEKALNSTVESYVWKPLSVKVMLFRSDSMMMKPEQNEAVKEWDDLALKGVETFAVGGDHALLFDEPLVQKLASQLKECLDKRE